MSSRRSRRARRAGTAAARLCADRAELMVECDAGRATDGRARGKADAGRARCPGARRPGSSRNSHPHVEGPWQSGGGETALSCRADRNVCVLALALAMVGVFGVLAYSVQQRTREVGVRIALGAGATNVLGLVLGSAARMIGVGVAIGLALVRIRTVRSGFSFRRDTAGSGDVRVRQRGARIDRDGRVRGPRAARRAGRSGGSVQK